MSFIKDIFARNAALAWTGMGFLVLSLVLSIWIPYNEVEVLGINSLIKPLKFSISIWIFCWTTAYIIHYFNDKRIVKRLTVLIILTMLYEQAVITIQAMRGTLSHFNTETPLEGLLFSLMGVFITAMTLYFLYANFKFWRQDDTLTPVVKSSIFWGVNIFVFAGLMGGFMAGFLSHNVGGEMGGESLPFVNWSTEYGDLRIGHFIGLHALQVIPIVGFRINRTINDDQKAVRLLHLITILYFSVVIFTFGQAFLGLPFWG
ncbi:MAG: hypothetical protein AAFP82_11970 [Bacteroidota bacterium]